MNQIKQRLQVTAGGGDLWGTEEGIRAFQRFDRLALTFPQGTVVALDCTAVVRSDVSFMRKAIVELLRRHRPRLGFIAVGVADSDVRSNLEAALVARGERLLIRCEQDTTEALGKPLPAEYQQTLRYADDAGEMTSAVLTQPPFNLGASTASARLATLWKAGLLMRHSAVAISGGKEYRYHALR